MSKSRKGAVQSELRQWTVVGVLMLAFALLTARVIQIQIKQHDYLKAQGDARYLRELTIVPQRGKILDRNGRILALSTPVSSVWVEPQIFCNAKSRWKDLLKRLSLERSRIIKVCKKSSKSDFLYLKRRISPAQAKGVVALNVPGVSLQREYRRYYPSGPVAAHLVGFTDIDDRGQEGVELQFDTQLRGIEGRQRVLKALTGHFVESVESIHQVSHGSDLVLSIDERLQYLASGYLEAAVKKHKASGGGIVVLSIPSGEILVMANSPQFNPNDRSSLRKGVFRNRIITDTLEPGSIVKPFTVSMALESGEISIGTQVDTSPGVYRIDGRNIRDVRDYGRLSVADVITHSSNIGVAKIALAFPFKRLFNNLSAAGFGHLSGSNLLGEVNGRLTKRTRPIEHATMAYGYGLSATLIQIARAYTVFASDGSLLDITIRPHESGYHAPGKQIFSASTAATMRSLLVRASSSEGTARKARVEHYRVAGKTGTTHKLIDGSYDNNRYYSLYAGFIPASDPRFVCVAAINDPRGDLYFGGDVAAPIFARLMKEAVRLYNVAPDDLPADTIVSGTIARKTT